MKKVIFALLFFTLGCASPQAQNTQTFSNYFKGLPQATTPLSFTEPMIVLQSGVARQTPAGNTNPSIVNTVYASLYGVSSSNSDNTAAMSAALAAAIANGSRLIQLPSGVLKFCSQMQWGSALLSGNVIAGAGNGSSNYSPSTVGQGTVIQACSTFSGNVQVVYGANAAGQMQYGGGLRDMAFDGNNSAPFGLFAKDVDNAVFQNITTYKHNGGAGIGLANSNNAGTQVPTRANLFSNIHIEERNETNMTTGGITCQGTSSGGSEGVTQNTWINISIDHANGNAITVGEDCDQQYWTNLVTFRANAETGNAIVTSGDGSSVIGNWTFNGILTSAVWNLSCCTAANIAWNVFGLNTGNWNSGVNETNFLTGTGANGVSIIDMNGNLISPIGTVTAQSLAVTGGSFVANGIAGISCSAGTVSTATLVVTNGIVTHC